MNIGALTLRTTRLLMMMVGIGLFVLTGCTTQQGNVNNSPTASAWKNGVRGQWYLTSIDKENFPAEYVVKSLFDEAPPECFVESVWNLPLNGKGNITFTSEGRLCAPGAVRNIQWSIYNPGRGAGEPQFQFKKIYPGDNPRNVVTGYRLDLAYADDEQLRMVMHVPLDGRTGRLIFNFIKY
ncbi:MAG TPA: hypothetical protein VFD72_02845 [Sphingobacteriaceae bacterium]|nr:hypothetical protein [Sphingobacteriaceae bacterium]